MQVYGWSWIVLAALFVLFEVVHIILQCQDRVLINSLLTFAIFLLLYQVFTFSNKAWVNFQLPLRLIQSITLLMALAGLAVAIAVTDLSVPDIFACILAFVPTGWGILSVSQ